MSSIKVEWNASEQLRHEEIMATGERTEQTRHIEIDLVPLTPERRNILVTAAAMCGKFSPSNLELCETSFDPEYNYTHAGKRYLHSKSATYDLEPDIGKIIDTAVKMVDDYKAAETLREQAAAEERRAKQEEKAAAEETYTARQNKYRNLFPGIKRLIENGNLDGLENFKCPAGIRDFELRADDRILGELPSVWSLGELMDRAIKNIKSRQREEAKETWIVENASAHLRRAFDDGYNCQRLYVQERAFKEAPDFTVDFNNSADWKDRSCPSSTALDLIDSVTELGNAKVIWLTAPAQESVQDYNDCWDEPFEEREAVIVRAYLGKYDLVSN